MLMGRIAHYRKQILLIFCKCELIIMMVRIIIVVVIIIIIVIETAVLPVDFGLGAAVVIF